MSGADFYEFTLSPPRPARHELEFYYDLVQVPRSQRRSLALVYYSWWNILRTLLSRPRGWSFEREILRTELTSSQNLPDDPNDDDETTFRHVAMVLNEQTGLSIFIDGIRVAHQEIIDNSKIDFPNPAATTAIFGVRGVYDDFRIYSGIVTPKHVKSVYDCGRNVECAQLAHAKPQSRRTYCVIPKTKAGSSMGLSRRV